MVEKIRLVRVVEVVRVVGVIRVVEVVTLVEVIRVVGGVCRYEESLGVKVSSPSPTKTLASVSPCRKRLVKQVKPGFTNYLPRG